MTIVRVKQREQPAAVAGERGNVFPVRHEQNKIFEHKYAVRKSNGRVVSGN